MKFRLNKIQNYLDKNRTGRDLILKPRQKGVSSWIEADQTIDCVRRPVNAAVISHEKEATKRLLAKTKYFLSNLEIKPAIKYETKQDIFFEKTEANFYIGTVGQKAVGRGDTLHRVHLSEAAYFENAKQIVAGITEAMPLAGSQLFVETTANGRGGWFYDEWQAAKSGHSVYAAHFFPWFFDDEYRLSLDDLKMLKISPEVIARLSEQKWTEEEGALIKKYHLAPEQIFWRRYKIWNLGEFFLQEYPEDDITCFLQSGRPVFKSVKMAEMVSLQKGRTYLGGIDGAEGIKGGDRHAFVMIDPDVRPMRPAIEIVSDDPINIFLEEVKKILLNYNVRLGVEKNGVGIAHCEKLDEWNIPFEKWSTDSSSRPLMITELEEAYRKDEMRETYPEAQNELLDMYYDEKNKPVHRQGKHDDRVFARAIAWQMRKVGEPGIRFL